MLTFLPFARSEIFGGLYPAGEPIWAHLLRLSDTRNRETMASNSRAFHPGSTGLVKYPG
jgi:hypothetical protein